MQPADRILLQTVYSLTTTSVSASLVRQCYNRRIADIPTIDKTIDQFSRSLLRLSEGFIRILDNDNKQYISMRNPSVNDFLDGRLIKSSQERSDLIHSICAPNQMRLIPISDRLSFATDLLQTGRIDSFIFSESRDPSYKTRFIGRCILSSALCIDRYRSEFLEYITLRIHPKHHNNAFTPIEQVPLTRLLTPEIWNYYGLKAFFEKNDNLYSLLSRMDLEDGAKFIAGCDSLFNDKNRIYYILQVERFLKEAISEFCDVSADDYEFSLDVEQAVSDATINDSDGADVDENEAAEILEDNLKETVLEELQEIIKLLPTHFAYLAEGIDVDDISVSGTDSLVEDFLSDPPGHHEPLYDENTNNDGYSPIDAIFQR